MKRLYTLLLLIISLGTFAQVQTPKREMRATWLATVWSLDWPSTKISETGNAIQIKAQKDQMIRILDNLASVNINAVFFQVRSRCDAMYKSSYEPWSSDLVTKRGSEPGYDPLSFVVEEAHKRGIEVHAWMNPYRFSTASTYWDGEAGDYRKTHPEWILTYPVQNGTYNSIMNPALPKVQQRITDIVREVVTNYDVDGIVFDDYFYAYGGTPADLDADAQEKYKPADMSVGDWRRGNINKMVSSVYTMIQSVKPYVTFGVSPFGIWTTNNDVAQKEGIVLPGGISGGNMYEEIYCDPVAWLQEGTVDYISPQLYWPTTAAGQDYDVLCPWWSDLSFHFKKHFYSSHSISGIQASSYTRAATGDIVTISNENVSLSALSAMEKSIWLQNNGVMPQTRAAFGPEEIGLQIERNRLSSRDGAPGSVFYSTKYIYNVKGVMPYLKNNCFTEKALVPAIDWKKAPEVAPVSSIVLEGRTLCWDSTNQNVRYVIYAVPADKIAEPGAFNTSRYLLGVSYTKSFVVPEWVDMATTTLAVAVFDRYGNEYTPVIMNIEQEKGTPPTLVYPASGVEVMTPFSFKWTSVVAADWYTVEVAEDPTFSIFHSSKNVSSSELFTAQIADLRPGKVYYWRVISHKAGYADAVSEPRTCTPITFSITKPITGSVDVELTPLIEWSTFGKPDTDYEMLIASEYTFSDKVIVYSEMIKGKGTVAVPAGILLPKTTYYIKVKAIQGGQNIETGMTTFTTMMVYPDVPVIVSPVSGSTLSRNSIIVEWEENFNATGFQAHLSKDVNFPVRATISKTVSAFTYQADYGDLAIGTYFTRVRANYKDGQTDWSPVVKFDWSGPTAITTEQEGQKVQVVGEGAHKILKMDAGGGLFSVLLYDIVGKERKVFYRNLPMDGMQEFPLDLADLPKGVYMLRILLNNQIWTLKLLN